MSPQGVDGINPSLWDVNKGPVLICVTTTLSIITTLVYCFRIAVRKSRSFGVGLDDWLTLVALMLVWALYPVIILFVIQAGLGRPEAVNTAIDPHRFVIGRRLLYAAELLYASAITTIKLGILAMYRRLLPIGIVQPGSIVLGSLSVAWWLAVVLVAIFQCTPVSKMFDPLGEESSSGHCINETKFFVANGIPNIITDVLILCLPIYQVWKLRLPLTQRVALVGIFMIGAGATAMSIIRLHFMLSRQPESSGGFGFAMYYSVLWSSIEINMAIICSCLPTLRPLLTSLVNSRIMMPVFRVWRYHHAASSPPLGFNVVVQHTIGGTSVAGFLDVRGKKKEREDIGDRQGCVLFDEEKDDTLSSQGCGE